MRKVRLCSFVFMFALAACNGSGNGNGEESIVPVDNGIPSQYNMNKYKLNKLVCDPFDDGTDNIDPSLGIKAELYYLDASMPKYGDVLSYIDNGIKSEDTLFFSDMHVPTRRFEMGFPNEMGEILQNDQGEDLVEYFALRFSADLQIRQDQEPGFYEIAVLADDGVILKLEDNGIIQEVVNNDGNHPTKMGCSDVALYFDHQTKYKIELDYYQGPKYHIALVPIMRKLVEGEDPGQDSQCGKKGNNMYFDFNNNSEPQQAYLNLLDRGWEPLVAENFLVTAEDEFNPCLDGLVPIISNFIVSDGLDGQIIVQWDTDIPASSQVRIVNMNTGEETYTPSDNMLRTEHSVVVGGFQSGVPYLVQAVSVSASFGKNLSDTAVIVLQ